MAGRVFLVLAGAPASSATVQAGLRLAHSLRTVPAAQAGRKVHGRVLDHPASYTHQAARWWFFREQQQLSFRALGRRGRPK